MAECFCKHFSTCSANFPHRKIKSVAYGPPTKQDSAVFNDAYNISELKQAISALKTGKSCGPDDIFPELITHLGKNAMEVLLSAINQTWQAGIPDIWRKAEIIPIAKQGKDPSSVKSYRPISLTSVLCKVTERMVNNRLLEYLDRHQVIEPEQAGFRKHMSTTDQIVKLTQYIKDGFHRKMTTLACFVDFQGAYDTVSRKILMNKVANYGVRGNMLRWLSRFLSQRFVKVRYGSKSSRYRQQKRGLPQGAVLSCALFNVMINDVITELKKIPGIQVLCYADDLTIWATSSDVQALENAMNEALRRLHSWCSENDMIVNKEKTTAQIFTMSTKDHNVELSFDTEPLEVAQMTKYLGVTLDKKLSWSNHIESVAEKATKRLCILRRLTGATWGASQDVLAATYKTYIRPLLEYGSEAYSTASEASKKKLDSVQNNALRIVCGAAFSTPITALETHPLTEPLQARRDKAILKFFERARRVGNFWETYRIAKARLKTQTTPLQQVVELQQNYQIDHGERQPFLRPQIPKVTPEIPVNLALPGVSDRKADVPQTLLKSAALDMLATTYPSTEWAHVYTDGSAMGENSGAGFYSSSIEGSFPVGLRRTNFDGEVAAVYHAAEKIRGYAATKKVVFLSDSTSALQAISSPAVQESDLVVRCREALHLLQANTEICLQWVPGHCDLYGNERADKLAKAGCDLPQEILPTSYHASCNLITQAINRAVKTSWKAAAAGKRWETTTGSNAIPSGLPRDVAVATFRMATGHDYLQSHLHRTGLVDSPICPLCNEAEGTADHLSNCRALENDDDDDEDSLDTLQQRSKRYWATRRQMTEMSRTGVG